MNTRRQVGKNSANWNPNFANWIQLANVCQLENQKKSMHYRSVGKLAVGNACQFAN